MTEATITPDSTAEAGQNGSAPLPRPRSRRRTAAKVCLRVGYALGLPGTLLAPKIMKERWTLAFAGLETGAVLITTGWTLARKWPHAAVNLGGVVGFAAWWIPGDRK